MIIQCPKCRTKYQLKDDVTSSRVRCKKCQQIIEVPGAPQAQRAGMKTMPSQPAGQADAPQRSEMKTAPVAAAAPTVQAEASGAPLTGKTLGGYEVLRKLGEGGMGAVYEAHQIALDRSVALKVLPPHLANNRDFITRFSREALSVARLNHTNIVQIHDIGKEEGTYFFSMEFVRGITLGDMIEKQGKMDVETAVGYILQAARGMEYAHKRHVIHRDIKPDNIMVNEEGVAKVADLGLAKQLDKEEMSVTMAGVGMGTPVYMSPEQGKDAKNVDGRADIYSLGCTLYHMITGKIPFEGNSAYEIITKHVSEPLVPPHKVDADIPEEISAVIEKLMAKATTERYQTMGEVIAALEDYLGVAYGKAGFEPTEGQIRALQDAAGKVEAAQGRKLGGLIVAALAVLAGVAGLLQGRWGLLAGAAMFGLTAGVGYAVFLGSSRKTYLYRRIRSYLFGNRMGDWVTVVVVLLAAGGLIVLLELTVAAVGGMVLGAAVAAGLFFGMKRPALKKRDEAVEAVRKLARGLRRKGVSDENINVFVCRHGGRGGELICEEMSGYDAVVATRSQRTQEELEKAKRPFATVLREAFIRWLNGAEAKRAEARRAPRVVAGVPEGATETAVAQEKAAEEAYIAEIVDEKKPGAGRMIAGIPMFLIGGKGRVTVGALMLLVSGLSFKDVILGDTAAVKDPNYVLFALALLCTGIVHLKAVLACFILSCLAAGPGAIAAAKQEIPVLSKELHSFGPEGGTQVAINGTFVIAAVFFILAFVAAFVFRSREGKG